MIENKEAIVKTCKELISQGYNRDDIDLYLKKMRYDDKDIAAINYELQYIYVDIEKEKQRREQGWSYIAASVILLLVAVPFTSYTIITGGFISLIISIPMVYYTYKFYQKGREILRSASKYHKFKSKHPYTPNRSNP